MRTPDGGNQKWWVSISRSQTVDAEIDPPVTSDHAALLITPGDRQRDGRAARRPGWPRATLGVVLGLSGLVMFGFMAQATTGGGAPTLLDQAVSDWFHAHRVEGLTTAMRLASGLGSTAWVSGSVLVVALGLIWKHAWHRLFVLTALVPGGMAMNVGVKAFFHRSRPLIEDPLFMVAGYSFPSGHTLAATLLYGGLVWLVWRETDSWRWHLGAVLAAFGLIALVGVSRVQLGAHYLSDVLGAFFLGGAWVAFWVTATGRCWRRSGGR